MCLSC